MKIYLITFNNYHGDCYFELYHTKKRAEERIEQLRMEALNKDKYWFDLNKTSGYAGIRFLDNNYNGQFTYIDMNEIELEDLFYD